MLDAVLDLFREGELRPRPEQVAERSGVSLRSVYRYYSDPDELLRAAMARHLEAVSPLFAIHGIGQGTFDERLERFVAARMRLYEAVAATARATRLAATRNDVIRARLAQATAQLRQQLDIQFAEELAALPEDRCSLIATAADALVQFEAVDYLRQSLDTGAAADVMRAGLARLLKGG